MKYKMQKAYSFLIALILCTLFAASAFAGSGDPASSSSKVIVEFEALGALETIKTDYKLALVTLKKRFPSELSVLVRDDSASGERKECIPVDWACVEDYDQTLDAYHFKPVFEGYELSDGVEPPMLTVVALHEPVTPPLIPIGGGGGESAVSVTASAVTVPARRHTNLLRLGASLLSAVSPPTAHAGHSAPSALWKPI